MNNRKYLSEVRPMFVIGGKILDLDNQYAQNREDNARHLAIAQNLIQNPNIVNVAKAAYHAYRGSQLGLPFSGKPEFYNPVNTGVAPIPSLKGKALQESYKRADTIGRIITNNRTRINRTPQGKFYNTGAVTANDFFNESKIMSGQPIRKIKNVDVKSKSIYNDSPSVAAFVKKNNLETFSATNGKRYVKMPDGKIRSVESLANDINLPVDYTDIYGKYAKKLK